MFKNLLILAIMFSACFANAETPETGVGTDSNSEVIGTIKKTTPLEQKEVNKIIKKKKSKRIEKNK